MSLCWLLGHKWKTIFVKPCSVMIYTHEKKAAVVLKQCHLCNKEYAAYVTRNKTYRANVEYVKAVHAGD